MALCARVRLETTPTIRNVVGAWSRKELVHRTARLLTPVFYRIYAAQITGRRATQEPGVPTDTGFSITDVSEERRLRKLLRLVQRKLGR